MGEFFTVKIRTSEARRRLFILRTEIDAIAASLPEQGARTMVAKAKETTSWKDRTGDTRNKDLYARQIGPYRWRFFARKKAVWLNDGTGIYGPTGQPIRPTRARFLRFTIGTTVFYRRSVQGTKPTHFVDRARDQASDFVFAEAARRLESVIAEHNR